MEAMANKKYNKWVSDFWFITSQTVYIYKQ